MFSFFCHNNNLDSTSSRRVDIKHYDVYLKSKIIYYIIIMMLCYSMISAFNEFYYFLSLEEIIEFVENTGSSQLPLFQRDDTSRWWKGIEHRTQRRNKGLVDWSVIWCSVHYQLRTREITLAVGHGADESSKRNIAQTWSYDRMTYTILYHDRVAVHIKKQITIYRKINGALSCHLYFGITLVCPNCFFCVEGRS